MRHLTTVAIALCGALAATTGPAHAQTFNSGSTGADGAFSPTTNTTLALPATGLFNFTTVTIPSGVTVRFTRNAANTAVTFLANGNVSIAGAIDISATSRGNGVGGPFLGRNDGRGGPGRRDGRHG